MRYRVARVIWHGDESKGRLGVSALLQAGRSAGDEFGHKGKVAALDRIWAEREALLAAFMALPDDQSKIEWLGGLPWIGPRTRYHAAKNFAVDTAKPDRHLARLAGIRNWETAKIDVLHAAVMDLCRPLAAATGDRIATVDLVLWCAAEQGLVDTRAMCAD